MNRIAVIDYGMGNLHSVASALQHVAPKADVIITSQPTVIADADRVIFPGVGAIRDCMAAIKQSRFDVAVDDVIKSGRPILAICVGMQALMDKSEECGGVDCLAELPGQVRSFSNDPGFQQKRFQNGTTPLKVPHMGWNCVSQTSEHPLWQDIPDGSRFYFVHSYFVHCDEQRLSVGKCEYGIPFDAALARDNLFAVQFHPEKSHMLGLQLLKNFVGWDGRV